MINWTTEDIGANYYGRVAREFGYVMLITSNDNNADRKPTRLQLAIYANEQDYRSRWALWTGYEDTLAECQCVAANFLHSHGLQQ